MNNNTTATDNQKFHKLQEMTQGDYEAFLYDCDGTLADNMPAHTETYVRVAADGGVNIDGTMIDELAGWPIVEVVKEINRRYDASFDPEEFNRLKYELFNAEYIEKIQPIDYVVEHLIANAGKVRIGVVSGGSREAITRTLQIIGVSDLVEVMVCAGETPNGKPFPDPFLAAAEKLGVDPKKCLVFEDGNPGVAAAEAAGMKWIRVDKI
ncbi:HAD superfamily hydrolase (TIGR01509 family)/HAD superfamily hydrolase (TIGR01549 family) [Mucilaginibacter yixingensis]|uniref:HAD superfamily hydrolase (TIGR01509 family)/HAD superfamily hydrolase (TIGR01549 family) n=1 Tax=Mucilaginibacter yixingensis TaxID=1295612 RepID=A0A2T5JDG1_9SPHI|nr:HAD family phosphatase [Mucilaginibacter yixingensis]PTQ99810.1 HAD superfamily hydrolase (TIGR01509 family)/HAD superfamily hydrolase (TIGR01549 family) [Mucilaginibacter yixingensis]